jgi:hypothetical protein
MRAVIVVVSVANEAGNWLLSDDRPFRECGVLLCASSSGAADVGHLAPKLRSLLCRP